MEIHIMVNGKMDVLMDMANIIGLTGANTGDTFVKARCMARENSFGQMEEDLKVNITWIWLKDMALLL